MRVGHAALVTNAAVPSGVLATRKNYAGAHGKRVQIMLLDVKQSFLKILRGGLIDTGLRRGRGGPPRVILRGFAGAS